MALTPTVKKIAQIGIEATPGTLVPATKRLPNYMIKMKPEGSFAEYRSSGSIFIENVFPGEELAKGSSEGGMSYSDVVYPLASLVNYVAPTGDATNGYVWSFKPSPLGADAAYKTYSLETGDANNGFKFAYTRWSGFTMKFNKKEARQSGELLGRAMSIGAMATSGVTVAEKKLIVPNKVNLFHATTMAGLAGSSNKVPRLFDVEFTIANRWIPVFQMDSDDTSFVELVLGEPEVTFKLKLGAQTSGSDLITPITLAKMRAGEPMYFRVKSVGEAIGTGFYTLFLDVCAVLNKPLDLDDENGVTGLGAEFRVINDGTADYPFEIGATNKIASI